MSKLKPSEFFLALPAKAGSFLRAKFLIPMLSPMRRIFFLISSCVMLAGPPLGAQDRAAEASARAHREEAEERYKLLNSKLESIIETQELLLKNQDKLQQRIGSLAGELEDMKRAHSRSGASFATIEQLKELAEKMKEIDRKRADDKELILKTFKELQKIPMHVAPPPTVIEPKPEPVEEREHTGPTYDYTVKKGDFLEKIIAGYNEEFEKRGQSKITVAQVMKANPKLDRNKLFAGKIIKIPVPPKKDAR